MTKRLIVIPVSGIGEINCNGCEYIHGGKPDEENTDDYEDDPTGRDRNWCGAFEQWIPWDDDESSEHSERLPECIDAEVM